MLIYMFILVSFFVVTTFVPEIMQLDNESLSMEVRSAAADRILLKHLWVWPTLLVVVSAMGVHFFLAFQRIVGPIYRFRRTFEQVRNGDLSFIVKIREKDYLHAEEESLNGMLQILESKIKSIKKASHEALDSFERIEGKAKEGIGATEMDSEALRLHRQSLEQLRETVQFFRLRNPDQ